MAPGLSAAGRNGLCSGVFAELPVLEMEATEIYFLWVEGNPVMERIEMPTLQNVEARLEIKDNPLLTDLSGLMGLRSVRELEIRDNPRLSAAAIQELLDSIGSANIGRLTVEGNGD